MKVWITRTYKWGNHKSSISFGKGLISIIIIGLAIDILYSKRKWIHFSKIIARLIDSNWEKCTFPVPLKYLE